MTPAGRLRIATPSDGAAVRSIYAPFCNSSVTFEETQPTVDEMADRIESTLKTHPWLVCEREDEVVGYAYASPLRKRRAYEWTVECSVYVARDARRSGVGTALYEALFAVLERQGFLDAYAVTTLPNPETVGFHERLGFDRVVDFPAMGYTQEAWHDVCWWRRSIASKPADPDRPIPFADLREDDDVDIEALVQRGEPVLD